MSRLLSLASLVAPGLLVAALLAGWEAAVALFRIPSFLLPAPSAIAGALVTDFALLAGSAFVTLQITLGAFLMASLAGVCLAMAFSASRFFARAVLPFVIALQVTPVIAIAPLIVIWVGIDRPQLAMLILASIVAFFPVLAAAMTGLRSVDAGLEALFRLYGASKAQEFLRLRIPSAAPYVLSAMKVAAGLALVGAVVAEFVAGSGASQGLAWRIIEAGNRLQMPRLFAALVWLTAMGLLLYLGIGLLERRVLGAWHDSQRS